MAKMFGFEVEGVDCQVFLHSVLLLSVLELPLVFLLLSKLSLSLFLHLLLLLALLLPKSPVVAVFLGNQLVVRALLNNDSVLEHDDLVTVSHSGESMGNDERGRALRNLIDGLLNLLLGLRVKGRGGLIEAHDLGLLEQGSSNGDPLLLSSRQLESPLAHELVVAPLLLHDELVDGGALGSRDNLLDQLEGLLGVVNNLGDLGVSNASVGDVVEDGVIEEHAVLGHDGDVAPEVIELELGDVLAVDENLARLDVVESVQEPHDRALPRSRLPDDADLLARLDLEGQLVDDDGLLVLGQLGVVGEADVLELDLGPLDLGLDGVGGLLNHLIGAQEVEHLLDVDHALPDPSPERAEEAEGLVDLHVVGVEHDEGSDGQLARLQELVRQEEGREQAQGDHEALRDVKHDEATGDPDVLLFVLDEGLLESLLLVALRIEVLDCLEVEQRVSRLLVVVLVCERHVLETSGSPLGEVVGGGDVDEDGGEEEEAELPAEEGEVNHEGERDLGHDGDQRERSQPQHLGEGGGSLGHDSNDLARLPAQVEGQALPLHVVVDVVCDGDLGGGRQAGVGQLPDVVQKVRSKLAEGIEPDQKVGLLVRGALTDSVGASDGVDCELEADGDEHVGALVGEDEEEVKDNQELLVEAPNPDPGNGELYEAPDAEVLLNAVVTPGNHALLLLLLKLRLLLLDLGVQVLLVALLLNIITGLSILISLDQGFVHVLSIDARDDARRPLTTIGQVLKHIGAFC
uniref:Uncharacterized protein n=1 Tax=Strombidium rassoulzadegani TaxID=1082188 RepID=A0A7S3CL08_9SPIT|mmetsp:Transcript_14338/g.24412  ORF Transcript_14338/g.24412 Transcript_14338/m.24412 type:complete len:744 (+) Transcript_14338:23-2254(+)